MNRLSLFLRFERQLRCQKTMLLRHGRFSSVKNIVDELFTVRQWFFSAVNIAGFFFIRYEKMVSALVPSRVNILANFNKTFRT